MIFVAEVETAHTMSHGYGSSPEQAMSALLECWIGKYAAKHGADTDLLRDIREDIQVYKVALDRGYVIGSTDDLARPVECNGGDPRFDEVFETSSAYRFSF